jgi:hypothetical protein
VKPVPQIVQTVTAGSAVLVLVLLASASPGPAQMAPSGPTPPVPERRGAPATSPGSRYDAHQRGTEAQPQQGAVFVDAHVDAHVNKAERPAPGSEPQAREERRHPWSPDTREPQRWTPGAERYTRPPQQWNR